MTGRGCSDCGETLDDVNTEAFEITGRFLCELCVEAVFENDGQPDEQQEWESYDRDC